MRRHLRTVSLALLCVGTAMIVIGAGCRPSQMPEPEDFVDAIPVFDDPNPSIRTLSENTMAMIETFARTNPNARVFPMREKRSFQRLDLLVFHKTTAHYPEDTHILPGTVYRFLSDYAKEESVHIEVANIFVKAEQGHDAQTMMEVWILGNVWGFKLSAKPNP